MSSTTETIFLCDCCMARTEPYSKVGFHLFWFCKYDVCRSCYDAITGVFWARRWAMKEGVNLMDLKISLHGTDKLWVSRWELIKLFFGARLSVSALDVQAGKRRQ